MAERPYTYNDASTRPTIWADVTDSSTISLDSNGRLASLTSKGTMTGAFMPPSSATAPLYQATAFNSSLPGLLFSTARPDRIDTTLSGPKVGTVVYVWQEPASSRTSFEVVVDHKTGGGGQGGRATVFGNYGGGGQNVLIESSDGLKPTVGSNPLGSVNVLVVEYNGSTSRAYFNGVETSLTLGLTLSGIGLSIGGKTGDSATFFGGVFMKIAVFPALFVGDEWSRITQGTMWDAGQQSRIANGATYKAEQPTVSIVAAAPDNASQTHATTQPSLVSGRSSRPDSATHAHTATSPSVSAKSSLTPQAGQHGHTASSPGLSFRATLAVNGGTQGHTATVAALGSGANLSVNAATQPHAMTVATLSNTRSALSPASAAHAHQASIATLSGARSVIAPAPASHVQIMQATTARISVAFKLAPPSRTVILTIPSRSVTLTT